MPATAMRLEDEGLVLEPQKMMDRGHERRAVLERFRQETWNPAERLGDLRAQVAANELGARRLVEVVLRIGVTGFRGWVDELLDYGERRVRAAIGELPRGTWAAEDFLEGAAPEEPARIRIRAEVTIGGSGIAVDFAGTDRQVPGNLNAPLAVTLSASSYVVRCLTDPDAPRNAGALRPLRVLAREGSLVSPRPPAAVAAGNVETSQRIVDVLFLALSEPLADAVPAQSQGTMNNLTIGGSDPRPFSYYETIAGGEGALPYRPGMSGVHTHMTNTRNTPVEALEFAYPLRIEEYRLIPATGGRGRHSGGDGIRRSVRFLARAGTVSILGLLAGALTGLSPGLHVNNVAALVLATQAAWTGFLAALVPDVSSEPETIGLLLSCFLLATAGSHAVFNFIPAVFLGAPTEDTALATLPGHCLLLLGQGAKAVAFAP